MLRNSMMIALLLISSWVGAQPQSLPANTDDILMTPILHATFVLQWNDITIYLDPYGGAERFAHFPDADLILITHVHGDHLNRETLEKLDLKRTQLVAPESVIEQVRDLSFAGVHMLHNGDSKELLGIGIEAVPMYNLPETPDSRHPKGKGNGYVLTVGGERLYVSGDTEDIPEMRKLKDIDYAFICMNLPYTMDVEAAASAVVDFKPKVMFPFHYRGGGGIYSDVVRFKELVQTGAPSVDVRILDWYPE